MNVSSRRSSVALIAGLFALLLGLLSPAVAHATDDAASASGSVSGTVTHLAGDSVSGLTVQLLTGDAEVASTETGDAGDFAFADVAPGDYSVRVAAGDDVASAAVAVTADADVLVSLSVGEAPADDEPSKAAADQPEGGQVQKSGGGLIRSPEGQGTISGTITTSTGDPVEGATVYLSSDDYYFWELTDTDETGYYEFLDLDPDDYVVDVSPGDGYAYPDDISVTVTAGGSVVQNFVLEDTAYLVGTITDADGGLIEDITIKVSNDSSDSYGYSNEDGEYEVQGFSAGTYTVELLDNSDTYVLPEPIEVEFATGDTVTRNFTLSVGDSISGTVTGDGGAGVGGVGMDLQDADGNYVSYTTTKSDGTYVLGGLAPGTYRLTLFTESSGYLEQDRRTVVVDGPVTGVDFELVRGATISGTVLDPDGEPVEDVELYLDGEEYWDAVYTDEDGNYSFTGVPSETYEIDGWIELGPWYFPGVREITVTAPETVSGVDFSLVLGGTVSGTVTGPEGSVGGVEVIVADDDWSKYAYTDRSGNYTVEGVPTGDYIVVADPSAPFVSSDVHEVSIVAPEALTGVDFELTEGGSISGTVTGPGGVPVTEGFVWAISMDEEAYGFDAFEDGQFLIEGLPTGTYEVYAESWDDENLVAEPVVVDVTAPDVTSGIAIEMTVGASISGTVTGHDGEPLYDVEVWLEDEYGDWVGSDDWTDEDGSFALRGLPTGTYTLIAVDDDNGHATVRMSDLELVAPNHYDNVNVEMAEGRSITGSVRTVGNTAAVEAEVWAVDEDGNSYWDEWTESDGTFVLDGLPAGVYTVYVEPDDESLAVVARAGIDLTAAGTVSVNFEVSAGSTLAGLVTDPDGDPLEDAEVWLSDVDAVDLAVYTDADGSWSVDRLPAGDYTVSVEDVGGWVTPASQSIELGWGETVEVDFAYTVSDVPGATLMGVVTDPDGDPLEDVLVWVTDGADFDDAVWTLADGSWLVEDLPAGDYTVSVEDIDGWDTPEAQEISLAEDEMVGGVDFAYTVSDVPGGPETPDPAELTDETQGGIEVPAEAAEGAAVPVFVGQEFAGEDVDVWLFSTPAFLGTHTVSPLGFVTVVLPAGVTGNHRIAVYDAAGVLIGWAPISIAAADAGTGGTGGSAGGTNAGAAAGGAALPATGVGIGEGLLIIAVAMLVAGLGFVATGRRETVAG